MMIVGLTGGIGSGKSTVSKMFQVLGVPVYDSDIEAKKLMISSDALKEGIIELLGTKAYSDKKLNRTFISNKIFNQPDLLKKLNHIVHPAVRNHFLDWVTLQKKPYVIQETALIFENQNQDNYDTVILVTAPEAHRIQRVMDRDGVSRVKVLERIANQLKDTEKIQKADCVIKNIALKDTMNQVSELHKRLLQRAVHG